MILLDNGEITSEDESDSDSMPPLEDANDIEHVVVGQTIVLLRELAIQQL